jgi:hypothetical protein
MNLARASVGKLMILVAFFSLNLATARCLEQSTVAGHEDGGGIVTMGVTLMLMLSSDDHASVARHWALQYVPSRSYNGRDHGVNPVPA